MSAAKVRDFLPSFIFLFSGLTFGTMIRRRTAATKATDPTVMNGR